eukprot:CAMPEP_0172551648 /NCGR_PEP_ID=MMETSP1067-20121228/40122_1 /TAXON_ID=265564 ORGANISM="Thalassiosira punctigera, Strain Tpunct2005C2" /NCGR_SAMPLE_ID=MMETSP1067 /ASSEMBLY_ACC=CAM_ASM_000444 /LENGTH=322 /DNA_ID=CAMNT_0013339457 /DNA_START=68 /DNA_END=1036 /DNA_ORIENTATION=+
MSEVAPSAPNRRRCSHFFVPGSLPFLCTLSLVALRPTSAFQLKTTAKACPPRRTIAADVSSDKDLVADILGSDETIPADATSEIDATTTKPLSLSDSAGFGESVPYVPLNQRSPQSTDDGDAAAPFGTITDPAEIEEVIKKNRIRNLAVAVASFAIAVFNYGWQFSHPVTAVQILASMEKQSAPLTAIGNNGKPTVVDFWAPWCENCKVAAPTLRAVEEEYGDRVNFIMVNGDDGQNWPLVQLFGVDAIPHLALLSEEGDVETALIGPMSRNVLRADIDALLNKRENCEAGVVPVCHEELPYKMLDSFGNRKWDRRVNFVEK